LAAYRNSNLLLSGVTIEGFTQRGIAIGDSSYLGVNDGYGMHTTFCDCPLTETLDFVNLLTFSGVA
jgi:hypothetical protein